MCGFSQLDPECQPTAYTLTVTREERDRFICALEQALSSDSFDLHVMREMAIRLRRATRKYHGEP